MIDLEDKIIECVNYLVFIKNDKFEDTCFSVNGKFYFKARLVVYLQSAGQMIFNLLDGSGTVVIPLKRIYFMKPIGD